MASADSAVQALQLALPDGQLHVRGSEAYEKLNAGYLSGLESDLRPLLIFQPSSVAEVVAFVRTIGPFAGSGLLRLDCAIRGAGQQPLPGCANVDNGITLDLSLLNSIALTEDNSIVQIGAGARWGAVYEKLDPLGLSVTGSRSAAGGVGGLALSGSYLCLSSMASLLEPY
jgi:FAD/FMN-containing dehydrogenase